MQVYNADQFRVTNTAGAGAGAGTGAGGAEAGAGARARAEAGAGAGAGAEAGERSRREKQEQKEEGRSKWRRGGKHTKTAFISISTNVSTPRTSQSIRNETDLNLWNSRSSSGARQAAMLPHLATENNRMTPIRTHQTKAQH